MVAVGDLDTVLPEADFVVLAAPLTLETRNLLDRRRIGLMKPGAGFFNICRAGSVDHQALVEALRSGAVCGAILDVYDPEPLPASSALWHADNLVLTPHVTSDDLEEYLPKKASAEETAKLVEEFLGKNSFTEKQVGQATGMFMKTHGAQVDAGHANALIRQRLAGK